MSLDYDSFLAEVLKEVPDDQKQGVEEALRMDALRKEIESGYSRQSDYSRKMDELKQAQADAEAKINQERGVLKAEKDRYAEWYEGANRDYQAAVDRATRYEQEYGKLENADPNSQHRVNPDLLTRDEYQRQLAAEFERRDRAAIDFADALTDAKLDHQSRFEEKLDTDALYAHVEKTGLPFRKAYDDYIQPRVREAEQAKFEEKLKQAKEEGINEGRSQAHMPVQPDSSHPRAIDSLGQSTNQDDRVNAAASAFREAQLANR
jgi:hypothetical protein